MNQFLYSELERRLEYMGDMTRFVHIIIEDIAKREGVDYDEVLLNVVIKPLDKYWKEVKRNIVERYRDNNPIILNADYHIQQSSQELLNLKFLKIWLDKKL